MSKFPKILLYILACIVVFLILAQIYDSAYMRRAEAFEWEKTVNIYLVDRNAADSSDCSAVAPFPRTILNAETLGPGSVEALFKGPTLQEIESGYNTSINTGVLVKQFEIKSGVAYVDLNSRFNEGVSGSCKVTAIRAQVEQTLLALPDINRVVISVDGETDGILEP